MFIQHQEIVKSFIFDICDKYEGGITFRVDIIQLNQTNFMIDLHRREIFSLRPHGKEADVIADKIFWLWANEILIDDEPCSSVEDCLDKVNRSFTHYFELEELECGRHNANPCGIV